MDDPKYEVEIIKDLLKTATGILNDFNSSYLWSKMSGDGVCHQAILQNGVGCDCCALSGFCCAEIPPTSSEAKAHAMMGLARCVAECKAYLENHKGEGE